MGMLRLLLATLVLVGHASGGALFALFSGQFAIQAFFVISGFYMQLIVEDYATTGAGWVGRFYKSRLIRLLPLYYLALVGTALMLSRLEWTIEYDRPSFCLGHAGAVATCLFTNLFIVGQELLRLMAFDAKDGRLFFVFDAHVGHDTTLVGGNQFSLLGQSWTLSLEMMFYAMVPLLLRRSTRTLIAVTVASLALKFGIEASALAQINRNWRCAVFPAELGIFLLGALAFRHLSASRAGAVLGQRPGVSFYLGYIWLGHALAQVKYGDIPFCMITAWTLPWLFKHQSSADRCAGECSYPVYITHLMVIYALRFAGITDRFSVVVPLAATLILAVVCTRWVDLPLMRWRHRHYRQSRPQGTQSVAR